MTYPLSESTLLLVTRSSQYMSYLNGVAVHIRVIISNNLLKLLILLK